MRCFVFSANENRQIRMAIQPYFISTDFLVTYNQIRISVDEVLRSLNVTSPTSIDVNVFNKYMTLATEATMLLVNKLVLQNLLNIAISGRHNDLLVQIANKNFHNHAGVTPTQTSELMQDMGMYYDDTYINSEIEYYVVEYIRNVYAAAVQASPIGFYQGVIDVYEKMIELTVTTPIERFRIDFIYNDKRPVVYVN